MGHMKLVKMSEESLTTNATQPTTTVVAWVPLGILAQHVVTHAFFCEAYSVRTLDLH